MMGDQENLTGDVVLTEEERQQAEAQHQEKLDLLKKVLEEQARIREDMKRQQDALFQSLGLSADDLGGGNVLPTPDNASSSKISTDSGSAKEPPSKKRKLNGNDFPEPVELDDPQAGNLWDVGNELSTFEPS